VRARARYTPTQGGGRSPTTHCQRRYRLTFADSVPIQNQDRTAAPRRDRCPHDRSSIAPANGGAQMLRQRPAKAPQPAANHDVRARAPARTPVPAFDGPPSFEGVDPYEGGNPAAVAGALCEPDAEGGGPPPAHPAHRRAGSGSGSHNSRLNGSAAAAPKPRSFE
jgi:hypothetical protein